MTEKGVNKDFCICTKCGIEKSVSEFYKQIDRKKGRKSQCKSCLYQTSKLYLYGMYKGIVLEDLEEEIWKFVVGFEGIYSVSNKGRVKSILRKVVQKDGKQITIKPRMMSLHKDKYGYYYVSLTKNGKKGNKLVHRLVAEAFLNNIYNKKQVNHKDLNKLNNNLDNLEWCSGAENQRHRYLNTNTNTNVLGVQKYGNKFMAVFTVNNVCYKLGVSSNKDKLAELYNYTVDNYNKNNKLPELYLSKRGKKGTTKTEKSDNSVVKKVNKFLDGDI